AAIAVSDVAHLAEEGCLLPEVDSLPAAQEHIEAVGMAGTIVTGEAVHSESKEDTADIGRNLINPVQSVHTLVVIRVGPQAAPSRNVSDRIIEGESRWETFRILGCRRNQVGEDL